MTLSPFDPRYEQLLAWLNTLAPRHGLNTVTLTLASTDASARRYFRVSSNTQACGTLIAVDAPPPEKCREFARIARWLATADIHAPRVLEHDFEPGFMLITDLGHTPYIAILKADDPQAAKPLIRDALDTLIRWQCSSREGMLPAFDQTVLRGEMALMPQWYIERHLGYTLSDAARATLERTFMLLSASARAQSQGFVLRDFMPRNLMVATPNPGVLDFQDAVYGPLTYDVVSLLRDAFISWDETFELDCFAYYWEHAKKAGLPVDPDFAEFYRQLEWMGLQRHLKVLGLFARLHYRDGKSRYIADLPRFVSYARNVARRYSPLAPLAQLLDTLNGQTASAGYTF